MNFKLKLQDTKDQIEKEIHLEGCALKHYIPLIFISSQPYAKSNARNLQIRLENLNIPQPYATSMLLTRMKDDANKKAFCF